MPPLAIIAGDDERQAARETVDHVEPSAAVGDREHRVVAPGGEHVVEGEREHGLLARLEAAGTARGRCSVVATTTGWRCSLSSVSVTAGSRTSVLNVTIAFSVSGCD